MKKYSSLFFALFILLGISGPTYAGLLMQIDDNGSGIAEFTLSGSDLILAGSQNINGVWLYDDTVLDSMFNTTLPSGGHSIVSGSGFISNTQYGSAAIFDVYLSNLGTGCCDFGVRNGSGGQLDLGDSISWGGVFTTDLSFSIFNIGTYDFATLNAFSHDHVTLSDGYQIVVGGGGMQPVPEPTTLALMGLGLAGISFSRRRKLAA